MRLKSTLAAAKQSVKEKVNPVDNWRQAFKMYSIQAMAVAAAIQGTWVLLPEDWRTSVPSEWTAGLTIFCLVIGAIGRLVNQDNTNS